MFLYISSYSIKYNIFRETKKPPERIRRPNHLRLFNLKCHIIKYICTISSISDIYITNLDSNVLIT